VPGQGREVGGVEVRAVVNQPERGTDLAGQVDQSTPQLRAQAVRAQHDQVADPQSPQPGPGQRPPVAGSVLEPQPVGPLAQRGEHVRGELPGPGSGARVAHGQPAGAAVAPGRGPVDEGPRAGRGVVGVEDHLHPGQRTTQAR